MWILVIQTRTNTHTHTRYNSPPRWYKPYVCAWVCVYCIGLYGHNVYTHRCVPTARRTMDDYVISYQAMLSRSPQYKQHFHSSSHPTTPPPFVVVFFRFVSLLFFLRYIFLLEFSRGLTSFLLFFGRLSTENGRDRRLRLISPSPIAGRSTR